MVSVTPEQLATVQVPLARPRVCFPRPPPRLYGLLAHRRTAARRQSSSKEAQELGTLRPTLVPAFRFFSLAPNRLLDWAGTHSDVLVIEWLPILRSANPHAAYLQKEAVFQVSVIVPTLASHSSQNHLLSIQHQHHQTGGCPWLSPRTSTTFPLPSASSLDT